MPAYARAGVRMGMRQRRCAHVPVWWRAFEDRRNAQALSLPEMGAPQAPTAAGPVDPRGSPEEV
eukprot:15471798-Alexandrium_andersonii.AAC.1